MKHVKLYEEFVFEAGMYDKYAKKVGWIMQNNDIRTTSGNINVREKKYNMAAKNALFHNYFTKDDFNNEKVQVVPGIPLLYYAGGQDKESETFIKNKNVNTELFYNKREALSISGDKTLFGKTFEKYKWLPKTVFSKKEALDGNVGFPVIAKIKNGHSGVGVQKFNTSEELKKSKDDFDLFCQFIDFKKEYRVVFCQDQIIIINERVPTIDEDLSINTKKVNEKIAFTYVYQDRTKIPSEFIKSVLQICSDIKKDLDLNLWSLDIVVDKKGKLWVMETSSATGLGSVKMCEVYKAVYEDFYGEKLPDEFLEDIYKKYVVPGHQNYWPKYTKEISSSQWAMDYELITDLKAEDGYRYFFNLDKK